MVYIVLNSAMTQTMSIVQPLQVTLIDCVYTGIFQGTRINSHEVAHVFLCSLVSPTFDPRETPSCKVVVGKTAQISCISIGYPIISKIIKKGKNGETVEVCLPPVASTANYASLGRTSFGMLNHTCNYQLSSVGNHEFICKVAFLSWGSNINGSYTTATSLYCNLTAGKLLFKVSLGL